MKTFCIVIEAPLAVARCPLPAKSCVWQHRDTNFCKYTPDDLSIAEHAALVGARAPSPAEIESTERKLMESIRSQVSV